MTSEMDIYNVQEMSSATVKEFLQGGGQASPEELAMLMAICKNNNMNPFLKEVYFIKYKDYPAQIVVSRDFYRKRAFNNPNFKGLEVGVIVQNEDGTITEIDGAFKTPKQTLVGAWARVYLSNMEIPVYTAVAYDEYVQMKNGQPNQMWTNKPCTMLAKVAESQALRMAFPDDFSGTYGEEEYVEPAMKEVTPSYSKEEIRATGLAKLEKKKRELEELKSQKEQPKQLEQQAEMIDFTRDESAEYIEAQQEELVF